MPNRLVYALASFLILSICHPAFADTTTALTEMYTDSGVPGVERPSPSGLHGFLGAGLFRGERISGDARRKTVPLPIVLMTYKDRMYWSVGGGGIWLYRNDDRSLMVGVGVKVRPGYNPDGDPDLVGMEKRRSSLDGYLNSLWKTEIVNIGVAYYHDIGNVNNGDAATIRILHAFTVTPNVRLTPSVGLEWESGKLVNYYYGVRPSEALPDRPEYSGHATVNYGAGVVGEYRISLSWYLLGGFYATHLNNGISDSPILSRRHTKLAYLGAGWSF